MLIELVVIYGIQKRGYRVGIDNLLVLLIGGIPIAMPTVLSVTMAIGAHRLAQQVGEAYINRNVSFLVCSLMNNEVNFCLNCRVLSQKE